MILYSIDWLLEKRIQRAGFVRKQITLDGLKLSYLEKKGDPSLPPLVLVHGISSQAIHWHDVLVSLKKEPYTVISVDLPGHGQSDRPHTVLSPSSMYEVFSKFIDVLVPNGAILLGNSLGGSMVLKYSALGRVKLQGLILISPAVGLLDPVHLQTLKETLLVKNFQEAQILLKKMCPTPPLGGDFVAWMITQGFKQPAVKELLGSLKTADFEPPFKEPPKEWFNHYPPTIVHWGKGDDVLPRESLQWLKDYFKNSILSSRIKFSEPDHWGHTPYMDDPKGFCVSIKNNVRTFMAQHKVQDNSIATI